MAVEPKRGCGFRRVGGLYLIGEGIEIECDRMPYELKPCPVCGAGPKFSRGWQWIREPLKYFGMHDLEEPKNSCACPNSCPLCTPKPHPYGLMSVGSSYYSPAEFVEEARRLGVSKRIAAIPRGLVIGATWVLLVHKKFPFSPDGELFEGACKPDTRPAIFYAFKPSRIERVITESQSRDAKLMESLRRRGVTPFVVPDDDPDHAKGKP